MVEIDSFIGRGFSSNVFVVKGKRNFLLDTGMGNMDAIIDHIQENDIDLDRIILTHRHYDHTANAKEISEELQVPLYSSELEAEALRKGDDRTIISSNFGKEMPSMEVKDLEEDSYAGFRILSTPGHTDGSISLYQPTEKILFSGDTVFSRGGIGRTDLPTGNMSKLRASLNKLSEFDVESLYPGHGPKVEDGGNRHIEMSLRNINSL